MTGLRVILTSIMTDPFVIFIAVLNDTYAAPSVYTLVTSGYPGIILWLCPANERRRCIITSSLIGWVHVPNDDLWLPRLYRKWFWRNVRHIAHRRDNIVQVNGVTSFQYASRRAIRLLMKGSTRHTCNRQGKTKLDNLIWFVHYMNRYLLY